jgi:hypothetical protein
MIFNPTTAVIDNFGNPIFGGQHYVYVMGHTTKTLSAGSATYTYSFPAYDGCAYISQVPFVYDIPVQPSFFNTIIYSTALYVGMPLPIDGQPWLPEGNDWKLSIRLSKPYQRYSSTAPDSVYLDPDQSYTPVYTFQTENIATTQYSESKAESDLDLINVVPNPYYAYNRYENNALDTRIKITNLPTQATITIYNVHGTLVRQLTKDESATSIEWDLNNFAGIPIAGGIYIIHVQTNVGEVVLKWFGIMRPPDLNTF